MIFRRLLFGAMTGGLLLLAGGCATKQTLPANESSQIGTVIKSQRGEIVAVRDVVINAPSPATRSTGMGSRIGSAVGRSAVPGGVGILAGAVGAVVGEAAGSMTGPKADDKAGEEITVVVEGGKTIMIVQERGSPPLAPGERVRLVTSSITNINGGSNTVTRVVRDDDYVVGSVLDDRTR
jgi:outer membrane lipoprotein SlyB